jgi:DNA-binding transcriptional ArsR family regulator
MANYSASLDKAFGALADPTRRAIISRLQRGPASVTQLAEPLPMAMPSVLKHLRVLTDAGLVATSKRGRVRMCTLRTDVLDETAKWIDEHRRVWETRLASLESALTNDTSTTATRTATTRPEEQT